MIWQDYVFTFVAVIFSTSLVPMAFNRKTRVPRATSIPTAMGLWMLIPTQISLGLVAAPVLECLAAACWTWIALRRG